MRATLGVPLLTALMALVTGCGGARIEVNGHRVEPDLWRATVADLRPRAAFDLRCAPEDIEFTLFELVDGRPVELGASGCDRRIVYSRANVGGYISGNWLAQPGSPYCDP